MTLVAAWVRTIGTTEELVLATDSRLTGGHIWDAGPKLVPLARGDSALCFAGVTAYAYPLLQHIQNYIAVYDRARSRALDLNDLKGHILRVVQRLIDEIEDPVTPPYGDFGLVLAGYSWRYSDFRIWSLEYDLVQSQFFFRRATSHARRTKSTKKFWFIGDHTEEARVELYDLLQSRKKLTVGGLDMEPFEVLVRFIRDSRYRSIGGPPQLLKVYRHMNTRGFNVIWPDGKSGRITYLGRTLLDYERNRRLTIDPDTLVITSPDP
jgi:hypothetical protein